MGMTTLCQQVFRPVEGLKLRPRTRRRAPDFAPSSETSDFALSQAPGS